MSKHKNINQLLAAFALGELPQQQVSEVKTHLAECPQCSNELKHLEALLECTGRIRELATDAKICDSAKKSLFAAVESEKTKYSSRPNIGPESIWRKIMKSPITKLAAAAVIILTIIIGTHHFGRPVSFTTIAFADISKAMKKMPWMHQMSKGLEGGITGVGEQWIGFEKKIHAGKWANGKVTFWNLKEQRKYEFNPESNSITIDYADEKNFPLNLSSPVSLLESMHKMLKEQGAEIITKEAEYNGQKAQLQEISFSSAGQNSDERHTLQLYIKPDVKLLLAAKVKATDANGSVVMDGEVKFEYPNRGPKNIYDLGVPRTANVVNNFPPVDVSNILANYNSYRKRGVFSYIAIIIMKWPSQSAQAGAVKITYCNGKSMRTERRIAKRRSANWSEYPNDNEPNFDSLLRWWTSDENSKLSEIFLYDGEYDYYVYGLPDRLKSYRTKGHNPNHKSLNDISWPDISMWIGSDRELKIVETDYTKNNNLICIKLLFQGRVILSRKDVSLPQKRVYYLDQLRDYICTRQEYYQLQNAPWQKDKAWLDRVDPNVIPEDLTELREVSEFARTDTEQWYPKKIKTWLNDDMAESGEPTHIDTIYLRTEPQFPKGIFDTKSLPK
jgi:hypothetical protein